jgi:GNAT superfamily N-acetyltransferase
LLSSTLKTENHPSSIAQLPLATEARMTTNATHSASFNENLSGAPSFLRKLRLSHGPIQQLAKFLLDADNEMRATGIALELADISLIREIHSANADSWISYAPTLDARYADLTDRNSYCFIGRDPAGRAVTVQAGRIYDTGARSLADIAADQSLYYSDNRQPSHNEPRCTLTSPSAVSITGTLVYSGALWVHPDYRGNGLAGLLPRLSRAYALGVYGTNTTFAFVSDAIRPSALFKHYGYNNIEPAYRIIQAGETFYEGSLMWMETSELARDLARYTSQNAKVGPSKTGGRQNQRAAI